MTTPEKRPKRTRPHYHHGQLPDELVEVALRIIAERGVDGLSMAEAARRTGVSPRAPYRHYPSAAHLLMAAATRAGHRMAEQLRRAIPPEANSEDGLICAAGAYARFLVTQRAGFDLIFNVDLDSIADDDLRSAGRSVMNEFIFRAIAVTDGDARQAIELIEQIISMAHGYGSLFLTGFLRSRALSEHELVERVTEGTTRLLHPYKVNNIPPD